MLGGLSAGPGSATRAAQDTVDAATPDRSLFREGRIGILIWVRRVA